MFIIFWKQGGSCTLVHLQTVCRTENKGLNNKQVLIDLLYWFDFLKLNQYISELIKVYCFNIN